MPYEIKPLSCDPKKLKGLSEKLIVSHWENNYGGAVKRLNAITAQLASLALRHGAGARGSGAARRAREGLQVRRAMADRVCRHGQGDGRRLGLGAADVFAG
jgi:hypothetical protein